MKTTLLQLGGREIALQFTMDAWEKIEDEICMIDALGDKMAGKGRLRAVAQILSILAVEPITPEQIWAMLTPPAVKAATNAIWEAVAQGMNMETNQEDDGAIHDVILEEIEKKETGAD